jgi:hypothetical protein
MKKQQASILIYLSVSYFDRFIAQEGIVPESMFMLPEKKSVHIAVVKGDLISGDFLSVDCGTVLCVVILHRNLRSSENFDLFSNALAKCSRTEVGRG